MFVNLGSGVRPGMEMDQRHSDVVRSRRSKGNDDDCEQRQLEIHTQRHSYGPCWPREWRTRKNRSKGGHATTWI